MKKILILLLTIFSLQGNVSGMNELNKKAYRIYNKLNSTFIYCDKALDDAVCKFHKFSYWCAGKVIDSLYPKYVLKESAKKSVRIRWKFFKEFLRDCSLIDDIDDREITFNFPLKEFLKCINEISNAENDTVFLVKQFYPDLWILKKEIEDFTHQFEKTEVITLINWKFEDEDIDFFRENFPSLKKIKVAYYEEKEYDECSTYEKIFLWCKSIRAIRKFSEIEIPEFTDKELEQLKANECCTEVNECCTEVKVL